MRKLLIGCVLLLVSSVVAQAEDYPSRPVTMIVPLPAGSAFDVAARILAEGMQTSLGQPVVVENVTGAAGSIGTGRVARAAPDGYTLCFGGLITHVINGVQLTLPYDVVNDFEPVGLLATTELLVVARKGFPTDDLKGLIAWLKANPDKASQGSGGLGSLTHLAGVFFQQQTGTRFNIVPYRGAGAAINDLVAGHIDFMFDLAPNSLPHVHTGAIKAYAVMAKMRLPALPDVPTVDEAGLAGFYASAWQAMWAPKNTPHDAVQKLNAAIAAALENRALRSRLADIGEEIFPREQQTSESLASFHKAELDKWKPIIKAANGAAAK
ncbi:Bug family tripartite tricarboxylate transporter substrate binding protein [Rhodoplanes sp. Z2-YC6860]|uniref:Bug family tripartite tricarboxylate transporter substrate binding protein n=1 Tax=Rhodoplanes sp. Z2-YC6860 TaxID=674703 RepID=UPI00078B2A3B|nr:tripartite tricarboxylate transporter substrate-binding protein [Rhodoplanes sp. Z2-YC6860]AMN39888.1 tricarboxylate transport protein [Rhodoplanes sp. Z2-YC6860]